MDLQWFLDISEYNEIWNPDGDNDTPGLGAYMDVLTRRFSVPIPVDDSESLSILDFISRINDGLQDASARGAEAMPPGTNRTYQAFAEVAKVDATEDQAYIQYTIKCLMGDPASIPAGASATSDKYRKFSIDFNSGPHNNHPIQWDGPGTIETNTLAEVEVINRPYPVIGTFPTMASGVVTVQDNPPIEPDVEFVPYSGVNDKILLLISGQTGQKYTWPVIIKPTDVQKFANVYSSQGITDDVPDAPIIFKSDDPVVAFQIFRTTAPPTLYSDFEGHQLAEYTEYSGPEGQSLAAYIDDTIVPNTKYYYCFRSIDVHENISNPGPVIEFEMVDNNGQIYPVISHYYGCGDRDEQSFVKTGKRFIYIAPSTRQTHLETGPSSYVATHASAFTTGSAPPHDLLGVTATTASDKVWNNVFKIRVTSKKTGRKVDLNLVFKNRGVIDP